MKKLIKITLIISFFIILILGIYVCLSIDWRIDPYENWPDYYKELAEDCEDSCCISSVEYMAEGNYRLSPKEGCSDGFEQNMLKCPSSYKWCEPIEEFCGVSTFGSCASDSECIKGGCSGQVCQNIEEEIKTICEYRDCFNTEKYNAECKCHENKCQWIKLTNKGGVDIILD